MSACEWKLGLLVPNQGKGGRLIALQSVALFTCVEIGSRGELCRMLVGMAVGATLEADLEQGLSPLRDMTLFALQLRVPGLERICRGGMLFHSELGRLKTIDGMAGCAFTAICAFRELAHVCIFVTVHAFGESQRLLEVPIGVALNAFNRGVLALQGILRLRMVEVLADVCHRYSFPTRSVVTRLAAQRKTAAERIGVAIGTFSEGDSRISRLIVRSRRVAFLATHVNVLASERIASLRVIELLYIDRFPVIVVVALQAIGAKPPLVLILVAGNTGLGKSEKRSIEVRDLDQRFVLGDHVRRHVTATALQPRMLAFQRVPRLLVIERLGVPLDKREVLAVMIGMATDAFLAGSGLQVISRV